MTTYFYCKYKNAELHIVLNALDKDRDHEIIDCALKLLDIFGNNSISFLDRYKHK